MVGKEIYYQQFDAGLPGAGNDQPGKGLVYIPYEEGLRTLLDEAMDNWHRPIWSEGNRTWYLHMKLRDKGSQLAIDGREAEAALYKDIATALGIVGYHTLREGQQYQFRKHLRKQMESKPATFTLPDQGRRLLQLCASVLDIPYNPLQEEFTYATVLDQPEIEPPTEEDYINKTEKALRW